MNKVKLKSKKWLDPNTTGFIYTLIEHDDGYRSAELKLSDCSRIVSFDVFIESVKARDKTLKKVKLMIAELSKFNEVLQELTYGE